jgi:hypothetical protein
MSTADDYPIDFSGKDVSPARTPGEAAERFDARVRAITYYNAAQPLWNTLLRHEQECLTVAIARFERALLEGRPVDDESVQTLNAVIRGWRVQSHVGSTTPLRTGEYDVALRGLVTIAYRYRRLLEDTTYTHLLDGLLNQRGRHDPNIEVEGDLPFLETENHILMIESSRYLTNQLLFRRSPDPEWNNRTNGLADWILGRLRRFLRNDFEEYNARMYQTYSTMALCNLHDFAEDDSVRRGARMVLDYKAAKFAVSSNELRRSVPFRRRKSEEVDDQEISFKDWTGLLDNYSDPDTFRFLILTGLSQRLADQPILWHAPLWPRDMMQITAVSRYRVPRLILDLIMTPEHRRFYQRFRHAGMEAYFGTPASLLSAGGMWMESVHGLDEYNGYQDAGWAMPTTIMPTGEGINRDDFIRIDGAMAERERTNTAVAPGFACGLNPRIPSSYRPVDAQGRIPAVGPWSFVDGAEHLGGPVGIHVALYSAESATDLSSDGTSSGMAGWNRWGFFEVAEARDRTFDKFVALVLERNAGRTYTEQGANEYTTVDGLTIGFTPNPPGNKYRWGITLPGSPTDIAAWPLAAGDIMNSDGHIGLVRIDNPYQPTLPRAGSGRTYDVAQILRGRKLNPREGVRKLMPRGQASLRSFLGAPAKALVLDFRTLNPVRTAPHYSLAEFRRLSRMVNGAGTRTQLPAGATSLRELLTEPS